MERRFWLERWTKNQIGFHQPKPNPWLEAFWGQVQAQKSVFVPLCGKSLDMRFLEDQGLEVIGIDFAALALEAYFEEAGEVVVEDDHKGLRRFKGDRSTLYCGDIFALGAAELATVDAVFDRGALVALPPELRRRYAEHLQEILAVGTRVLLVTLEYDQGLVAGPPFSVLPEEVKALYGERCEVRQLVSQGTDNVPPHFSEQGVRRATEAVYLLSKKS
ncbi:MAG: thiopurine S-methyltransferase [Pseudomonadales bacterium]